MDLKARTENMRQFFNRKIDTYDEVHEKFLETKALLASSLPEGTKKVLDLGVGTGLELTYLFERFPEAEVTGIDVSEEMIEALKCKSFGSKVTCILGDFFETVFGSGYDAAISTSALHHFDIESKIRLYKKVYDSLREGGMFINSDYISKTDEEEENVFEWYRLEHENRPHIDTPLTSEHEKEALLAAGFREVTVSPTALDNYRLFVAVK